METTVVLEWIGYAASVLIVISMLMSSIVKLRLINMTGAILFSLYGFLIHAMPVGFLNLFVVLANLYYLSKMARKKEYFTILPVRLENRYLIAFLKFHGKEIKKFFNSFDYKPEEVSFAFFVLRDMAVAGVFIGTETQKGRLKINLDFVIPEYRDYKPGRFIYDDHKKTFIDSGYTVLEACPESKKQEEYYIKMGFVKETKSDGSICMFKNLE